MTKYTVSFTVDTDAFTDRVKAIVAKEIEEGHKRPWAAEKARVSMTDDFDNGFGEAYFLARGACVEAWMEAYAAEWRDWLERRRLSRLQHRDDEHEADNTGPLRVRPLHDPPPSQ